MKRTLVALILSAVLFTISFSRAQTPDSNQKQKLFALIKEVQAQQAQMAANQKQIEEKLRDVSETVRTARIYAGRGQ